MIKLHEYFEKVSDLLSDLGNNELNIHQLLNKFKNNGGIILGNGKFSTVLTHPNWNPVYEDNNIKVFRASSQKACIQYGSRENTSKLITNEPAVITFTTPLEMVFTHPYWSTPARKRLLNIICTMKKNPDMVHYIGELNPGIEVFVKEKIPAKYFQRIDIL